MQHHTSKQKEAEGKCLNNKKEINDSDNCKLNISSH